MCIANIAEAQEHLSNYDFHPHHTIKKNNQRAKSGGTLLQLPFFDDFIQNKIYPVTDDQPNSSLWVNSGTFVNFTYPINAPSYGCVTFDGLAGDGAPYSYVALTYGGADTLTSQKINLSKSKIGDSIYLSFFYEAEGNGDYPDDGDSLILEFKNDSSQWVQIWAQNGYSTDPQIDSFTQVLIPVKDSMFLDSFFQFRFRNYATLSGNNDHWHIDYVKLDSNRRYNSYSINDVAITNVPTRALKNYFHMPWNQYQANAAAEMSSSFSYDVLNNWSVGRNVGTGCFVTDYLQGNTLQNYPPSSNNLAGDSILYIKFQPAFSITNLLGDTSCRHIVNEKFYITPGVAEFNGNDTLNYQTIFTNYFSYDDGTAEKSWDVRGTLSAVALEFTLNVADTLKAIQVQWAHMNANQSFETFNLKVWSSLDFATSGVNDVVQHTETFQQPYYVDSINGLTTYLLDTAQYLPAGKFYIGFQQLIDSINIGFDVNNDGHKHLYYNTGLGWDTSKFSGALIMHPMFGSCIPKRGTGIQNIIGANTISVYPNPCDNQLSVSGIQFSENTKVEVLDLLGRKMTTSILFLTTDNYQLNTDNLLSGIYFLKVTDESGLIHTAKFVKE